MLSKTIKVHDSCGLHLRNSAALVTLAKEFQSKITLCHNCKNADTCSILELLSLGAPQGATVDVHIQGPDEKEAAERIEHFFNNGDGI
jgi:phosphocarrier protein HPr